MLQTIFSSRTKASARSVRVGTLVAVAVLLGLSSAIAAAAPTVVTSAQPRREAVAPVTATPSCPPAGFVRANEVGAAALASIRKDGETHYCVVSDLSWAKRDCAKYLPAEEYIRHKIGRADAVYSGMAVEPGSNSNIILFYCLPPRKQ